MIKRTLAAALTLCLLTLAAACGGDDDGDGGTEADKRGVGASCTKAEDCTETGQICLAFKGGYCGIPDCKADADCPSGSRCVTHSDGKNYCFRICVDKAECNRHRPVDSEANCSSSVVFAEGGKTDKACIPPSG